MAGGAAQCGPSAARGSGSAWCLVWWAVAAAIDLGSARLGWPAPGLGRHQNTIWQLAGHYLANRNQQLLVIALGESILAVGISYIAPTRTTSTKLLAW